MRQEGEAGKLAADCWHLKKVGSYAPPFLLPLLPEGTFELSVEYSRLSAGPLISISYRVFQQRSRFVSRIEYEAGMGIGERTLA